MPTDVYEACFGGERPVELLDWPLVGIGIEVEIFHPDGQRMTIRAFQDRYYLDAPYMTDSLRPRLISGRLVLDLPEGFRMRTRPLIKEVDEILLNNWRMGFFPLLREYVWRIQAALAQSN